MLMLSLESKWLMGRKDAIQLLCLVRKRSSTHAEVFFYSVPQTAKCGPMVTIVVVWSFLTKNLSLKETGGVWRCDILPARSSLT